MIGLEVLEQTAPVGQEFLGFTDKQKRFLRDFCDLKVPFIVGKCARGGSKTWLSAIGTTTLEYCINRYKMTVLGGSFQQTQYMYGYFGQFTDHGELNDMIEGEPSQTLTTMKDGGWVRCLKASEASVHGVRPDYLVIDEACDADEKLIDEALPQAITAAKIKITMISTPNKLFHTFKRWWDDADKLGIVRHHWTAYECPWIDEKVIAWFKEVYDENQFRIQILAEFGSAGGTVFRYSDVEASSKKPDGDWFTMDDMYAVFQENSPEVVYQGVDWGFVHPTTSIIAALVGDQVYIMRADGWPGQTEQALYDIIVERAVEHGCERTLLDGSHVFQNNEIKVRLGEKGLTAVPVPFGGVKADMIANVRRLLEQRKLHIPREHSKLLEELASYSYKEGTETPEKKNDDYVDGLMLACWSMGGPMETWETEGVPSLDDLLGR